MERDITLRIVLEAPPPGVDFGVQKGRGSAFETIQTQRSTGGDLSFEFSVPVKAASAASAADFGGPIVQGPPGGRFVYIDIGTVAGQRDTAWSRRLKGSTERHHRGAGPRGVIRHAARPRSACPWNGK